MPNSDSVRRWTPAQGIAGWLAVLLLLLLVTAVRLGFSWPAMSTDITTLLPSDQDEAASEVVNRFASVGGQTFFLLLDAPDSDMAAAMADSLGQRLSHSGAVLQSASESGMASLGQFLYPYRFGLLTADQQRELQQQEPQQWLSRLYRALSTPGVTPAAGLIAGDPLLLFPDYLQSLAQGIEGWQPEARGLSRSWKQRQLLLTQWQLQQSAFEPGAQQRLLQAIEGEAEQWPEVTLTRAGVVFHAAEATTQAKREMTWLGSASLLLVVLFTLVVFRRLAPLGWLLLVIGSALLVGASACLLVLGQLHAITLVFGTTLVGVAVDYTLHLSCQPGDSARRSARALRLPMLLALLSSCLAYLVMIFMPFPGLKQMAVFSIAGLLWAFLTVQWMPVMGFIKPSADPYCVRVAARGSQLGARLTRSPWLWLLLTLVTLFGLGRLSFDDDVRHFQQSSESLLQQQRHLNQLLPLPEQHRMLLLSADSEQHLLQLEESLRAPLQALIASQQLQGASLLTDTLPSLARQQASRQVLARAYASPSLAQGLQQLGFAAGFMPGLSQQLAEAPVLTPAQWLAQPGNSPLKLQWLGEGPSGWRSVVLLIGVQNVAPLKALAQREGVRYLDRVEDLGRVMAHYRLALMAITLLILVMALLLISRVHPWKLALLVVLPPVAAMLLVAAVWGLAGIPMTLFHMLGLLLMLGIALDQTLFLASTPKSEWGHCSLAILLSVLSTVAAFGMLGLSSTPPLAAFGQSLSMGLLTAAVLAPVVERQIRKESK
ncbi:MMPL family transporter [Ferrimonas sp. SCSIO 43195]|uniref:MMPL family transporter n=1 Tax=Ferrimonas sp. SCSIO 43195 TaxID=2822844 RepID=UPI002074FF7F|nr:hypothetical protein [Ferrimonas sp. SCSIO 43195]USD39007.1 hypothetical protein J8Z22_07855 [Ferrimonas sp. SCSIO 43195]